MRKAFTLKVKSKHVEQTVRTLFNDHKQLVIQSATEEEWELVVNDPTLASAPSNPRLEPEP